MSENTNKNKTYWTTTEDALLVKCVEKHGINCWVTISSYFSGKTPRNCRDRYSFIGSNSKPWEKEEDKRLLQFSKVNGWDPEKAASNFCSSFKDKKYEDIRARVRYLRKLNVKLEMKTIGNISKEDALEQISFPPFSAFLIADGTMIQGETSWGDSFFKTDYGDGRSNITLLNGYDDMPNFKEIEENSEDIKEHMAEDMNGKQEMSKTQTFSNLLDCFANDIEEKTKNGGKLTSAEKHLKRSFEEKKSSQLEGSRSIPL